MRGSSPAVRPLSADQHRVLTPSSVSSTKVITNPGSLPLLQVVTLSLRDVGTDLPGEAGGVDGDGVQVHGLAVTAGHEVDHEVELRLVPAEPATAAGVEVHVTDRDEAAVEGGVCVNGVNKLSVIGLKPSRDNSLE